MVAVFFLLERVLVVVVVVVVVAEVAAECNDHALYFLLRLQHFLLDACLRACLREKGRKIALAHFILQS
jgi:hypothetical protein